MFLPTYSCPLNPIERLWSLLKRKWCQYLQLHVEELNKFKDMRNKDKLTKTTSMKLTETISKRFQKA